MSEPTTEAERAFTNAVNARSVLDRGALAVPHLGDVERIWAAIRPFLAIEAESRASLVAVLRETALAHHTFNGRCTTDLPHCRSALCVSARDALARQEET